jgi:phosphosulfolactate phosphohydrolase-like enzyme
MRPVRAVTIDSLPESAARHADADAFVCLDVMLATTTLVTAAAQGRSTYPVRSLEEAKALRGVLHDPIVTAEIAPAQGAAFDGDAGPAGLERRGETDRPLVFVTPWAELLRNASRHGAVYLAGFRNVAATASHLAREHTRVILMAVGHSGQARCEDQMAAARIARALLAEGFEAQGPGTTDEVRRWSETDVAVAGLGKGAEHLRRLGRHEDLEFVLGRVDDLDIVCQYHDGEVRGVAGALAPRRGPFNTVPFPLGRLAEGTATA